MGLPLGVGLRPYYPSVAVATDFSYLRRVIAAGQVRGPVLEVGSRDHQRGMGNARLTCEAAGLPWEGTDIAVGPGVDFTLDVLDGEAVAAIGRRWSTVLLFNLLEHVYDPIVALRHAVLLAEPGGVVVVVGPSVWELHDFPRDFWRPMPDFFLEFARREGLDLINEHFCWLLEPHERIIPIATLTTPAGQKQFPGRNTASQVFGSTRATASRYIQRGLNLTGRAMHFPQVGIGVLLKKSAESASGRLIATAGTDRTA